MSDEMEQVISARSLHATLVYAIAEPTMTFELLLCTFDVLYVSIASKR